MSGNNSLSPVYKVMALYIGAVIGAGFASGQEILQFFIIFGRDGLKGVVLAGLLFSYLGGLVMYLSVKMGAQSYRDLYRVILGRLPEKIMDYVSLVVLSGGTLVMLSGGGAVFSEHLGLPHFLGTFLIALICIVVILKGTKGVISANVFLVPVKVIAIFFICLAVLFFAQDTESAGRIIEPLYGTRINWIWSSILYVSYNMVVPLAVLTSVGRSFPLPQAVVGGATGGGIIGVLIFLLVYAGFSCYPQIIEYEVPLLFIAGILGVSFKIALGILIWIAILTTAIANTHGFASRFAKGGSPGYKKIGIGIILFFLPLSTLKFSVLVQVLYPLFGYGGLILLAALLLIPIIRFVRRKLI